MWALGADKCLQEDTCLLIIVQETHGPAEAQMSSPFSLPQIARDTGGQVRAVNCPPSPPIEIWPRRECATRLQNSKRAVL